MADELKNFAYSTIATAPSPATSGTSLIIQAGHGVRFPTTDFNAVVWPANQLPLSSNAEIVRVTNISTDTFTITREQEGTSARSIQVGDQIAQNITALMLDDIYKNGPFVMVAASDAPALIKERADYICDGTADQTEINTALAAYPFVYLSSGTFSINGSIIVSTNNKLVGSGEGTIIQVANGADVNAIDTSAGQSVFFVHLTDFVIEGNKANQTASVMGIYAHFAHTWWIENLHIKNTKGPGIKFVGNATYVALNNWIRNCRIEDPGMHGIWYSDYSPNNHVLSCIIGGTDDWYGIELNNAEIQVIECHIHGTASHGIYVNANNCIITANYIESAGGDGIKVETTGDGSRIVGNVCFNNTSDGIEVSGQYIAVIGNRCFDRQDPKTQDYGINLDANSNDCVVIGNAVVENGTGPLVDNGTNNIVMQNTGYLTDNILGDLKVNETAYFDGEVDNGNSGAADTIDWGVGNKQKSTVNGNVTYTMTNPPGPCNVVFKMIHDNTANSYTRAFTPSSGSWYWSGGVAPTWTQTANAVDIISAYFDGTNWYAAGNTNFS